MSSRCATVPSMPCTSTAKSCSSARKASCPSSTTGRASRPSACTRRARTRSCPKRTTSSRTSSGSARYCVAQPADQLLERTSAVEVRRRPRPRCRSGCWSPRCRRRRRRHHRRARPSAPRRPLDGRSRERCSPGLGTVRRSRRTCRRLVRPRGEHTVEEAAVAEGADEGEHVCADLVLRGAEDVGEVLDDLAQRAGAVEARPDEACWDGRGRRSRRSRGRRGPGARHGPRGRARRRLPCGAGASSEAQRRRWDPGGRRSLLDRGPGAATASRPAACAAPGAAGGLGDGAVGQQERTSGGRDRARAGGGRASRPRAGPAATCGRAPAAARPASAASPLTTAGSRRGHGGRPDPASRGPVQHLRAVERTSGSGRP